MEIEKISAREIIDSRGNPTLKIYLETRDGEFTAGVPSGASTGEHEAIELRDGGDRLMGKGVKKAIKKIEKKIAPELEGLKTYDQKEIDKKLLELDGTENKENLGANSILGVSIAACKAGAFCNGIPLYEYIGKLSGSENGLPRPLFNVVNGGSHTGGGVDFQEFMISPDEGSFKSNYFRAAEIYGRLGNYLEKKNPMWKNIGDEGGYVPELKTPDEVLSAIKRVADVDLILDVAATEFFEEGVYKMKTGEKSTEEMIDYYQKLTEKFPIIAIEDPLEENDFEGWSQINKKLDQMIIGDDLLVTNPKKIKEAIEKDSCNGMILKINQIGTITESLEAARLAKENGWEIIVSHRSGETTDSFIADFSVGVGSGFIKSGAPARGERVVKYNRLLEIEEEISI